MKPPERLSIERIWPHLLAFLCCVLVFSLVVVTHQYSTMNQDALTLAKSQKDRLSRINELMLLLAEAESGMRGYSITHSDPYLESYVQGRQRLAVLMAQLDEDYPAADSHREPFLRIKALAERKIDHIARQVEAGRLTDEVTPGQSGDGKRIMDELRLAVDVLKQGQAEESQVLEAQYAFRSDGMSRVQYLLALGAVVLIVLLFIAQRYYSAMRERLSDLLATENARLEATVAARTRELNDLASYLTNVQEAERGRLARELHDELGALLTAAKMDASWLLRSHGVNAAPDIQDRFRRLIDSIGAAIILKRRIIEDLRPPLLQGLGLVEALRALADSFSVEVPVRVEFPESEINPAEDQSLALFRIAQESLTNIRKYAQAAEVRLCLSVEGGHVILSVEDDGVGFDPARTSISRHGLAGMKHRVLMFDGEFAVRSSPGQGTRIEVRMPLREASSTRG